MYRSRFQADVQAELMAEAFGFYADNIVTEDYLDITLRAAFAEQDAKFETRFAAIDRHRSGCLFAPLFCQL